MPPDQMTKQALDYIFWLQPDYDDEESEKRHQMSTLQVALERT